MIAVFGDYDVDGATSAALLQRFLAAVGARVRIYVPDRQREGYGPNAPALLRLEGGGRRASSSPSIAAPPRVAPLTAAAEAGLDVIVVDHHVGEPALPRAFAVINPNRLDETSPHGVLAAVGVAFLLVVGVNRALRARRLVRRCGPSPICCNGSISWRWARSATWCRSPASTARWWRKG